MLCIWHKGDNNVLCIPFRWLQSAKGTVLTMICSFGGGSTGLVLCYIFYGGHVIHIGKMVTTVMGSLVRYSSWSQWSMNGKLIHDAGFLWCNHISMFASWDNYNRQRGWWGKIQSRVCIEELHFNHITFRQGVKK